MLLPTSFESSCTDAISSHVVWEKARMNDLSEVGESVMTPKLDVAAWCAIRRGWSPSGTVLHFHVQHVCHVPPSRKLLDRLVVALVVVAVRKTQ
jgi:hypothetical protein